MTRSLCSWLSVGSDTGFSFFSEKEKENQLDSAKTALCEFSLFQNIFFGESSLRFELYKVPLDSKVIH
jgi:hypothetical protein